MTKFNFHPYHLVDYSPWPITSSIGALLLTSGLVKMFHNYSFYLLMIGISSVMISMLQWWRDVTRESTFQGIHTKEVISMMRMGMILFILSEVLFFMSFFWAFFHMSLSPTFELGSTWPPFQIMTFNPFQIPLLNTSILLASGASVTWAHHSMLNNNHSHTMKAMLLTVALGLYFTALQAYEYIEAPFTISCSVYGTTFFVATGFHGLHVIMGTTFLLICMARISTYHMSSSHHVGFEAAAWYWHFVDVVWLFLYVSVYWWGN